MRIKLLITTLVVSTLLLTSFKEVPKNQPESLSIEIDQNNPTPLVGKWVGEDNKESFIDIKADGTAIEKTMGQVFERTWSVKDGKLCMKASKKYKSRQMCLLYTVTDKVLTLTFFENNTRYIKEVL